MPIRWIYSLLLVWALVGCDATPLAGHIDDQAMLFSPQERAHLDLAHSHLLHDYDIDYQVITAVQTGDIAGYALSAFERRRVGERSKGGRGLLLIVDPTQNRVRLEVSGALEGIYEDGFIAYLERRQMEPFFQRSRIADGILAASEMIVTRAQNAQRNAGFESEEWVAFTTGAGASAHTSLGQLRPEPWREKSADIQPSDDSPAGVIEAYLAAMAARNGNANLPIFSRATREMLREWVTTPAQMDNLTKAYAACHGEETRIAGDRAVVRYPIARHTCSPWFLVREDGAWRLDLTTMQTSIRFGRGNRWHFLAGKSHSYEFAFTDWRFDKNGFPMTDQ